MKTIETPDTSHLIGSDFDHVYEPAEDSFLLIDAFELEFDFIRSIHPTVCLEIGTGSGIIITALAKILGNSAVCFGTDVNPKACGATLKTSQKNNVHVESVNCDLISPLHERLKKEVDIIVFNPPYVPTVDEEIGMNELSLAWAGGLNGRRVMDRFFPLVDSLLSDKGVFYLVIVKENDEDDIMTFFATMGFKGKRVVERRAGREYLMVLKFVRA